MEKNYSRRKPATGSGDKPVRARRTTARKFSAESSEDRPAKRPYRRRESGDSAPETKAPRNYSSEKPARRTYTRHTDSDKPAKRSYTRRTDSDKPSYGEKRGSAEKPAKRSYTKRADSEKPAKRSYTKRTDSEKPAKRTYTRRTDSDKPSYGEKPAKRTYAKRLDSDKVVYREKPAYKGKPAYKEQAAPAARKPRTVKKAAPAKVARPETQEYVRLNKFIANSGVCSRREADEYIQTGLVTVNGEHVTELGAKVRYDDDVRFNGQRLKGETKVYLVMNKPKDYVTTLSDPHAEKTVMDLISATQCPQRIYPVGRLDKATTGVLMFTNDGELTEKLTHPAYGARKIYHVHLDTNLKKDDFDKILEGIELEDGEIHADALSYVDDDLTQVGIEIHSGRNRIVRRIFEYFGYNVKKLDRVYFAGLTKKALKRGEWRFLTESEVNKLRMGSFE